MSLLRRDEALRILREHAAMMQSRFDVRRLALFGSVARDDAREDSDLDLLVEFQDRPTSKGYFGLLAFLEDLFGRRIDLVTASGLREFARSSVEQEAVGAVVSWELLSSF